MDAALYGLRRIGDLERGREQPARLNFQAHQDCLDLLRNLADDVEGVCALEWGDFAKSYVEGKICLVIQFVLIGGGSGSEYQLVVVPNIGARGKDRSRPGKRYSG